MQVEPSLPQARDAVQAGGSRRPGRQDSARPQEGTSSLIIHINVIDGEVHVRGLAHFGEWHLVIGGKRRHRDVHE